MVTPIRSCKGQAKSVGGFGACLEVLFVLKECNYINWDTLELDRWLPQQTIISTPLILLHELKNTKPTPPFCLYLGPKKKQPFPMPRINVFQNSNAPDELMRRNVYIGYFHFDY